MLFHLARGHVGSDREEPPGYSLVALTIAVSALLTLALFALSALAVSALAVGLLLIVALARLIAVVSIYRWSDIVEQLGKWVRIRRAVIVIVTIRVAGVARQAGRIVVLPEGCTGSQTVVSCPAPTRQHEG